MVEKIPFFLQRTIDEFFMKTLILSVRVGSVFQHEERIIIKVGQEKFTEKILDKDKLTLQSKKFYFFNKTKNKKKIKVFIFNN